MFDNTFSITETMNESNWNWNQIRRKMKNKTPAEERDIFRPELFYNYINLRLKNN